MINNDPVRISSLLQYPLNKKKPSVDYTISQWIQPVWEREGHWKEVHTEGGTENPYKKVVSILEIPLQSVDSSNPRVDFSQTLCLKVNGAKYFSYLWINTTPTFPRLCILQPFFVESKALPVPEVSIQFEERLAVHHGTYLYFGEVNKVDVEEGGASIGSIRLKNNIKNVQLEVIYIKNVQLEVIYGESVEKKTISSGERLTISGINIPKTDLAPSNYLAIAPFWMRFCCVRDEKDLTNTVFQKGLIFDQNGYPYLAQAIPVHGDIGQKLRATILSDGNILMIGTMDLDPECEPS